MTYDYEVLFEKIISAIESDAPPSKRMHIVIEECMKQKPHEDWPSFSLIDFDSEILEGQRWFQHAFSSPLQGQMRYGLWFGIFNPAYEGNQTTADIYVGVSPKFEEDEIDWAFEIENPEPSNYLHSGVLAQIYSMAYDSPAGLGNDAEHPLALAYAGILAHTLLANSSLPESLRELKGAAVGFDSGDVVFLGEYVNSVFQSNVRA